MLLTGGVVLALLLANSLRSLRTQPTHSRLVENRLLFLIRGEEVVDSNAAGRQLIASRNNASSELEKVQGYLAAHFDKSEQLTRAALREPSIGMTSRDGSLQASRVLIGDTIRLKVSILSTDTPVDGDLHTLQALETELETLRANAAAAPFLVWRQSPKGEVTWLNRAYLDTAKKLQGYQESTWPLPVIFPSIGQLPALSTSESRRISISGTDDSPERWFDCHLSPIGSDLLCTAIPADEAVQSEFRRREFTQTLTKTFAELAIGLAIFDRSRRLVLFNPALLDLTNLPTDFLSSRPSLVSFLDRLRENQVMPEPRDYKSWRMSITELEAAAVDGTYSDTWSLPDGQTYHVTGRPHPDGAVALLFEDISAEMSLTRHFRAELEESQSVLDSLEDAVAVFSPSGDLVVANSMYQELWSLSDNDVQTTTLTDATQRWREDCAPTPIWGDVREFARAGAEREEWSASVAMLDGRRIFCRFAPKKGGGTIVIFRLEQTFGQDRIREAV